MENIIQIVYDYVSKVEGIVDLQPPKPDQKFQTQDLTFFLFQKQKKVSPEQIYQKLQEELLKNV
jgi:hypothetical protein